MMCASSLSDVKMTLTGPLNTEDDMGLHALPLQLQHNIVIININVWVERCVISEDRF